MARRRPDTWLPVGSISTGTLRMEDLIPAMLDAGECIHMTRADRSEMRKLAVEYRLVEDDNWFLSEEADWLYEELTQLLDGYCPPFTYLGSHEGDGADIGVWISWDALEDGEREGDVWRSDDLPTSWKMNMRKVQYWLHVNDHGNCTMYDRAMNVLWEVV